MDLISGLAELLSGDWQGQRLLRMDFPRGDGPPARMLVNSIDADEALSRDFAYVVEVLSDDASIPIPDVMGRMVTISLVRDDGTLRYFNGYVTQFGFIRTDGGFARYRMVLSPWLAFLRLRQNCKLFQNLSLTGILEKTFEDYVQRDYQYRLLSNLPEITLAIQYNESDHNHIHRRLEDAGLFYWYEHRYDGHTLWISDDSTVAQPLDGDAASIMYRAESGSIEDDGISHWMPSQTACPVESTVSSFDFKIARPGLASGAAALAQGSVPVLEAYESTGAYGFRDGAVGDALAVQRMEQLTQNGVTVSTRGNHRSVQPGRCFSLCGHFIDGADAQYFVVSARHTATNNYQANHSGRSEYANEMKCVQKDSRWRPLRGHHSIDTRIFGIQTATVVGPAGEEVYTDEYGRVRVQFHWDREGQSDPASSPWIRVMTGWAGLRYGQISTPRIGHEVVVQFLEGNCDRPLIIGSVFNGANMPVWELSKQHPLSGHRSREIKGNGRSNHVILDDTPGKIQAQLKSDHAHSQLSLGHIGRIDGQLGRVTDRGEGWEVATDAWGVARAGKGMLITTEARPGAGTHLKSMDETIQRLTEAEERHRSLASQAHKYGAQDGPEQQAAVSEELKKHNEAIQGTAASGEFPELESPELIISSASGLHANSARNSHFSSSDHLGLTAGRNVSIAAGDSLFASVKQTLRIFVRKAGMRLVAAAGPISLRAKDDDIEAVAKKVIRIISESDWVDIRGKQGVRLHGSGSMVEIGEKVQFFTESPTLFHGNLETLAPKNKPQPEPPIEDLTPSPEHIHFTLQSHATGGVRYSDVPYSVFKGESEIDSGITDRLGRIIFKHVTGTPEYTIKLANGEQFTLRANDRLAVKGEPDHLEHSLSNIGKRALDGSASGRDH